MKFTALIVVAASVVPTLALPEYEKRQISGKTGGSIEGWQAPGPNDARGPCPGLNTLANHGFLPRDGRGISRQVLTDGIKDGFNINALDAAILFSAAVRTNTKYPLARDFDLETLGREGVLEHDISLSRSDRYFGNPLPFNETVWMETMSYFTEPMITVQQLADARMGRLATSKRTNPQHSLNAVGDGFSWGECASFFEIMADGTTGTVKKEYIDYWVRNERMPTELGWAPRTKEMQASERTEYSQKLMQAAGVQTSGIMGSLGM